MQRWAAQAYMVCMCEFEASSLTPGNNAAVFLLSRKHLFPAICLLGVLVRMCEGSSSTPGNNAAVDGCVSSEPLILRVNHAGKTVQAIALLACYRADWPALIITPSSLRGAHFACPYLLLGEVEVTLSNNMMRNKLGHCYMSKGAMHCI